MDSGAIADDGPTATVLQGYLERERAKLREERDGRLRVRSVTLRGAGGNRVRFTPGEKAWVDVVFKANEDIKNVAVVLQVLDDHLGDVFNTSSERLGHGSIDLLKDESCSVTFELDLHLTNGTFHVAVYLYRYDVQREFDRVLPAATFFVESDLDVRGGANLYPRVVSIRIA
jgi:hypothetical protein